jgi:hypothetical protein
MGRNTTWDLLGANVSKSIDQRNYQRVKPKPWHLSSKEWTLLLCFYRETNRVHFSVGFGKYEQSLYGSKLSGIANRTSRYDFLGQKYFCLWIWFRDWLGKANRSSPKISAEKGFTYEESTKFFKANVRPIRDLVSRSPWRAVLLSLIAVKSL